MAGERILITGATGFFGQTLAAQLAHQGFRLTLLCRSPDRVPEHLRHLPDARLVIAPDLAREVPMDAFFDVGWVVHLAGLAHDRAGNTERFNASNTQVTRLVVEAALGAGLSGFVFLSSIRAIGGNASETVINDESVPTPQTDYGQSKLAAEGYVSRLAGSGVFAVSLRPPLIVGADAPGNWRSLQKLAATGLPLPFASLENLRSFVSTSTLGEAVAHLVSRQWNAELSGAYAIADGRTVTPAEIVVALRAGMGQRPRLFACPHQVFSAVGALTGRTRQLAGLTGRFVVDAQRFNSNFGFAPTVDLIEAIQKSGREFGAIR